ncbi:MULTISPECIES: restriction endonuclease subunit S [Gammaproteobacteria]|uniref:restriction endonuclease subunit S n=1 Tax=Gammaproteobacteria TaxID=1236 RepID=UPI0009B98769|nr:MULTISPECIES: restriction endonuclease subunit S [Gammaproteobacteria]MCW9517651.1 restriction endonuclease subunit S [Klebsiella michiganensis]NWN31892.1 restriction endonuclease subunit S [Klebsiella michiganensis]QQM80296.1 restriction endonuclease subunit S [Klebsiella quasipneumoniae]SLR65730.1 type I restriction-modification system [Klebsiella pneumoniae]SWV38198.1 type I restriction-modification system [Klebsiella pneumoniae]
MISSFENCPDNWSMLKIDEIAIIQSGTGFPPDAQGLTSGTIPFLKVSDMNLPKNSRFIEEWNNSITEEQVSKLKAKILPPGAVIFPKIGGAIATNKKRVLTIPSCFDNNVMGLKAKHGVLDEYLYWLLQSIDLVSWSSSSSLPSMKASTVKEFFVPVPSMAEQKYIVEKLDALFTRIDTAIEHLQESVILADALYASTINEQMMQAIELAGISTVEKHIKQIQTGTTPPTKQPEFYENGDINWFAPSDFGDHDILSDSNKKLSQKAFDAGKARKFDAGTIMLVAIGATIGKIGYLEQDASSNQQITGMKFNSDIIPRYAYYWFRFIKPEILANASTATLPIINQKGIKALSFCAPNKQLQETICKKIDEVSNFRNTVKAELIEKVELMRSLKASILDSAFKGEL